MIFEFGCACDVAVHRVHGFRGDGGAELGARECELRDFRSRAAAREVVAVRVDGIGVLGVREERPFAEGVAREPGDDPEGDRAGDAEHEQDRETSGARRTHRLERHEGALEAGIAQRIEQDEIFFGNGAARQLFAKLLDALLELRALCGVRERERERVSAEAERRALAA